MTVYKKHQLSVIWPIRISFYERIGRKLSIGEKRNLLVQKSRGEIIVQFDDDDYYCHDYVRTMVSALSTLKADLINVRSWFLYDCRSRFFGYWNLMQKEGLHYRCDQAGVVQLMLNSENNGGLADNHLGYGFSYAFKKKVWKEVKFPEIDWNEDAEFSLKASSKFKVDGIHDTIGICLHILHLASTLRCFPQHTLPSFLLPRLFPALKYLLGSLTIEIEEPSALQGLPAFPASFETTSTEGISETSHSQSANKDKMPT